MRGEIWIMQAGRGKQTSFFPPLGWSARLNVSLIWKLRSGLRRFFFFFLFAFLALASHPGIGTFGDRCCAVSVRCALAQLANAQSPLGVEAARSSSFLGKVRGRWRTCWSVSSWRCAFSTPACCGCKKAPDFSTMSEEHSDLNSTGYYFDSSSTRVQSSLVFSGPMFVLLMVMMVTLVVVIVLGNALVIWAFKVDKSLRRQCNYYFLNLAISDFLVGECFILIKRQFLLFFNQISAHFSRLWPQVESKT